MSPTQKRIAIFAGFAVCVFLLAVVFSRRGYGEVTDETYQYAKALYSICHRRDTAKLDQAVQMIYASHAQAKTTDQEAKWLLEIIDTARQGDWSGAAGQARQMMEDQVEK